MDFGFNGSLDGAQSSPGWIPLSTEFSFAGYILDCSKFASILFSSFLNVKCFPEGENQNNNNNRKSSSQQELLGSTTAACANCVNSMRLTSKECTQNHGKRACRRGIQLCPCQWRDKHAKYRGGLLEADAYPVVNRAC